MSPSQPEPVIENRAVSKSKRFQALGPMLGVGDRRDFYSHPFLSLSGRYFFTETQGWEFLRLSFERPSESSIAREIREQTEFRPDVQISRFQLGTSYIFSPIYGKYAWGTERLVHFGIFGLIGAGVRFAKDQQPYLEAGIGMENYAFSKNWALVPEFRIRGYFENRSRKTGVLESQLQLGFAWLLH